VPRGNKDNLPPKEEFFDVVADPGETRNLIAEKREEVAKVKARFAQWRAEMDATEPRGPFRNY
jgi:hypothetical protein